MGETAVSCDSPYQPPAHPATLFRMNGYGASRPQKSGIPGTGRCGESSPVSATPRPGNPPASPSFYCSPASALPAGSICGAAPRGATPSGWFPSPCRSDAIPPATKPDTPGTDPCNTAPPAATEPATYARSPRCAAPPPAQHPLHRRRNGDQHKGPSNSGSNTDNRIKRLCQRRHKKEIPYGNNENNDYSRNIQIAELNALNAALAVIKWKKTLGFYLDLEQEAQSVYQIDGNHLVNRPSS